jgi:hypothetical protein
MSCLRRQASILVAGVDSRLRGNYRPIFYKGTTLLMEGARKNICRRARGRSRLSKVTLNPTT